jgi:hypothetical protein
MQRMQQEELRRQYRRKQQSPPPPQQQQNSRRSGQARPTNNVTSNTTSAQQEVGVSNTTAPIPTSTSQADVLAATTSTKFATPAEIAAMINQLHQDLTQLLRQLRSTDGIDTTVEGTEINARKLPLWMLSQQEQELNMDSENDETVRKMELLNQIFQRTIMLQEQLNQYVEQKYIRPGTLHRHEFVALIGTILQIYSSLPSNVIATSASVVETSSSSIHPTVSLFTQTLELIDWIRRPPFGLELSHTQCHAVITVAARCQQWSTASKIYMEHIDPDIGGYIPVPVNSTTARSFTMDGLYCIARAALVANTLPVENVLDGVTKLMMVSPADTESCTCCFDLLIFSFRSCLFVMDYLLTNVSLNVMSSYISSLAIQQMYWQREWHLDTRVNGMRYVIT